MERFLGWLAKLTIAAIYVPIIAVVVYSFNASRSPRTWEGFSFNWYGELLQDDRLKSALMVSVQIGLISGVIATLIGLSTAVALSRYQFAGKRVFMFLVVMPIVVPEIVLGAALLTVFSEASLRLGTTTVVLGHLIISLPLSTLILYSALASLDPSLQEAAQDLGCNPLQYTTKILVPLIRTPILAAFLLCFTTSFGNIVISTFTNGVGSTTVPIRVFSLLKTGITPEINALGAVLIVGTVVLAFIIGARELARITTRTTQV